MRKLNITWLLGAAGLLAVLGVYLIVWPSQPGELDSESMPSSGSVSEHPTHPRTDSAAESSSPAGTATDGPDYDHEKPPPAQYKLVERFARTFASPVPAKEWVRQLRPLVTGVDPVSWTSVKRLGLPLW